VRVSEGGEHPGFLSGPRPAELLLFGGKGGVGKTTCAAAAALALALERPDASHLLVSTDPAHSLLDSFAGSPVPDNLRIMELDAGAACAAFMLQHGETLRELARRGTFFDDGDIKQLLDLSLPGLDELMAFIEIAAIVEQASHRCVVVDTAPMGHTLRWLALPGVLRTWLGASDALMAKDRFMRGLYGRRTGPDPVDAFLEEVRGAAEKLERLLRDPRRCHFVPVFLPEELVIRETVKFLDQLRRLEVPVEEIIVNRLHPRGECMECEERRHRQLQRLRRMAPDLARRRVWVAPAFPGEVRGADDLRRFVESLEPLPDLESSESPAPAWQIRDEAPDAPHPRRMQHDPGFVLGEPADLPSPETRMLMFAGKGGVGKTTLACATAVCRAREVPQGRALLVSTDPAHSLSACLRMDVGAMPVRVAPGLWAVELDAEGEFATLRQQYKQEIERFFEHALETLDLPFDRPAIEGLMDLAPSGVDEVMGLLRVSDWIEDGSFDLLILDCAPTGHFIRLLEMPDLVDTWLKTSFVLLLKYKDILRVPGFAGRLVRMSKSLKRVRRVLRDPRSTQVSGVSVLTEMALEETKDLEVACRRLGVSMSRLFLNMAAAPRACPLCAETHRREGGVLAKFHRAFRATPISVIPRWGEPQGLVRLEALGRCLYGLGTSEARDDTLYA
jgi:arsenite/tail-anchored protein-transporting ATPase